MKRGKAEEGGMEGGTVRHSLWELRQRLPYSGNAGLKRLRAEQVTGNGSPDVSSEGKCPLFSS